MDKGQNNGDILSYNRSRILQYLQKNKVCTRAQLSKALELTPASITKTVAVLMEGGLVKETGFIQGMKGRRSIGITLKQDLLRVIGVKLSRRNYAVGVFDLAGNSISTRSEVFSEDEDFNDVLQEIKKEINGYIQKYENIAAIGMAVPGPYFEKKGHIMLVTETKGWSDIDLQEYFTDAFPVPMTIKHDANSVALAEWWFGRNAGKQSETVISYLVGEGIGAGVIINGTVLNGSNGIAGEVGHISLDIMGPKCDCGNYGCLELYCSSLNFVKHAKERIKSFPNSLLCRYSPLRYHSVFEAAGLGDELAVSLVKRIGRYIGYGAVNLINAYDPDVIILSSDLSGGGNLLLDETNAIVRERVSEHILRNVSIELSRLQGDSILCGGAAVAIDYCLQNPEHLLYNSINSTRIMG